MLKPLNRKSPEDRRSVAFDPAVLTSAKPGTVLSLDAATGKAILANGDVPDPMWCWTDTSRLDSSTAKSLTVLEGPFEAYIDTEGYTGTPTAGAYLKPNAGKLEVHTMNADATLNVAVVARCVVAPDSDGVMLIKAIR